MIVSPPSPMKSITNNTNTITTARPKTILDLLLISPFHFRPRKKFKKLISLYVLINLFFFNNI